MAEATANSGRRSADPWRDNELARLRRLREDARRPLAVNLRDAIALSEFLCSIAGTARVK